MIAGDPSLFGPGGDDEVSGGPGDDVVYTDGTDLVSDGCEKIVLGPYPDPWDAKPFEPAPFAN